MHLQPITILKRYEDFEYIICTFYFCDWYLDFAITHLVQSLMLPEKIQKTLKPAGWCNV